MTAAPASPVVVHGWTLYAHPLFLTQVEVLAGQVEALAARDPVRYRTRNATKRLAAITRLAFDVVPQDPGRAEYRQGDTLGDAYRHWFRVKFFQQYRLFFRYHASSRIIVYAWVNDEGSRRAYASGDDAYRVFRRMLGAGHPPDTWDALLAEAMAESARLQRLATGGAG
jgi:toxin YhaV